MEPLKNKMGENGRVEGKEEIKEKKMLQPKKKKKELGGFKTVPFILGNDLCDRFASGGAHGNFITYLTDELNMPLVKASNIITGFGGTSSLTPLIGALIADSCVGRFWTVIAGSLIYQLGLVLITISATLPHSRPPKCAPDQEKCKEASSLQLFFVCTYLMLSSIGIGGIRPNVITLAADQFDMSESSVLSRSWNFFNWYLFSLELSTLLALTVVVYIQENVGWGIGFGIPTIAMAVSILIFVSGSPLYIKVKPMGSPLVRLAQVVVAAIRKRKVVPPHDPSLLYQNREIDAAISSNGRLLHTNQFKWLDKAAIIVTEDDANDRKPWRLATVHRVEELKSIIRMLPIWAAGILAVASVSHLGSFSIIQTRSMDRHVSNSSTFEIPPASMFIFGTLTVLVGLPLYERVFVPVARRFTGNPAGITSLQRMGIGFAISILATIVSALVEIKRKQVAAEHKLLDLPKATIPISVFWLLPQMCLYGIAGIFSSVGHMEFLYDQSPESMRSTAIALYWMAVSMGNYIGLLMVSLVHQYTAKEGNWLPDRNLNRGKLENYYWLTAVIQTLNLLYYVLCSWFYNYKVIEKFMDPEGETEGDVESAKVLDEDSNMENSRT